MASSAKREGSPPNAVADGASVTKFGRSDPTLDRAVQARIGDKLRAMYGELAEQPVPDRFAALILQLGKPGRETSS